LTETKSKEITLRPIWPMSRRHSGS
jgi:hypothetical protein